MTRKHFNAIAAALRRSGATPETVIAVAAALQDTNPRFDQPRFITAALPEETP